MTAVTIAGGAAPRTDTSSLSSHDSLSLAVALRARWLEHGVSTRPADRTAAEAAVTGLYRLVGEPRPEFCWVPSPAAAMAVLRGRRPGFRPPGLRADGGPGRAADWPVASRVASSVYALRARLDRRLGEGRAWVSRGAEVTWFTPATMTAEDALDAGFRLHDILGHLVDDPLSRTLRDALVPAIRTALLPSAPEAAPLGWYGQHDAYWIARYDVYERLGLATYGVGNSGQLALWAELARSAGWWWPGDGVCVLAERPVEVHTETLPGGLNGELRLHHPAGPAVRFADGAQLYALHGTSVPEWVLADPTVERIHAETNVEVRRCAIERIGWDAYIDQAGLGLVAVAADPGNPGSELQLYDVPARVWGGSARVLLVVNGSVERDGRRRRYGLSVPAALDDPVAAAGWSYGLSGAQYAQLARRT